MTISDTETGWDADRIPIGRDLHLLLDAARVAAAVKVVHAGLIQRRVRVGWVKAAHLVVLLQQEGVIGAQDSKRGHPSLISPADLDGALARIREAADRELAPPPIDMGYMSLPAGVQRALEEGLGGGRDDHA